MKTIFFPAHYTAQPGWYEFSPWDHRHRRRPVPPRIIRGDLEILHALYGRLKKQKSTPWLYQSGVLVFSEPYGQIQPWQNDIIDSFEYVTFGGYNPNRFGRLWCLHLTETKVEFHWCFLRTDLISHKLVDWYLRCRDFHLFDVWEDLINLDYHLASPKDPQRLEWIRISPRSLPPRHPQDLDGIQKIINDISVPALQNRDHLCNYLALRQCKILKARDHWLVVQYGESIFLLAGPCCHAAFSSPSYGQAWMKRKQDQWTRCHHNAKYLGKELEHLLQKRSQWLGTLLNHQTARYNLPLPPLYSPTTSTSNSSHHHAAQTNTTTLATPPKPKANPQSDPPAKPRVWLGNPTTVQCPSATLPGTTQSVPPNPGEGFGKVGGTQATNHSSGTPGGSPNAPPPTLVISLPQPRLPQIQTASPASDNKSPGPDQPPLPPVCEVPWLQKKQRRKTPLVSPSPPAITPPPPTNTPPPMDIDLS